MYVIGGRAGTVSFRVGSVFTLSDGQQQWLKIENFPTEISSHACAVMGQKIFVIGGDNKTEVESVQLGKALSLASISLRLLKL